MIQKLVKKIFGTRSDREIKQLYPIVDNINQLADSLKSKTDEELRQRSLELRQDLINYRKKTEKNAFLKQSLQFKESYTTHFPSMYNAR